MGRKSLKEIFYEKGFLQYRVAKSLGIDRHAIMHFLAGRRKSVGKQNRELIRRWLIDHGIIIINPRPKCTCPVCGKTHVASASYRAARKRELQQFFERAFAAPPPGEEPLDEITKEFIELANKPVHGTVADKESEGSNVPSSDLRLHLEQQIELHARSLER
jgi:hypothetical protein